MRFIIYKPQTNLKHLNYIKKGRLKRPFDHQTSYLRTCAWRAASCDMPAPAPSRDSFSAVISLRRSLQEPAIS